MQNSMDGDFAYSTVPLSRTVRVLDSGEIGMPLRYKIVTTVAAPPLESIANRAVCFGKTASEVPAQSPSIMTTLLKYSKDVTSQ